ncbi:hypothetical protein [Ammoniphilus sp. CFH 90114]|uniref:hypothetical protein n=1 Tax=Ammoniphilus sp. CFH 90114 TaxID=2493665 RepID=UPI00100ECE69|nr:hypothetical protein [Ammoniphilus sp. CFH 90114]RXT07799.1 hypothetical protein EIZ39_10230 [Ammoniphilus sp. CFH 90114]
MEVILYTVVVISILLSLVATIWIARKPGENKYDSKSKANVKRLTVIYGITTVVSAIIFVLYLYSL